MRAINSGNDYRVYDNSVKLFNGLPAQIYGIRFDPMKGYSLCKYSDIAINEKVYGVHEAKVNKALGSFKAFNRSLGIILSGDKGIGKSLFAKMLCNKAVEEGYPVIICDADYPGLAHFIDSIDQECVVFFDEFDKTFKTNEMSSNNDAQAAMLSLFDGVSMNKKLFCITCNDTSGLNNFLINRPGRFHYHFRFNYPNKEEIEDYLKDHIAEDKYVEIEKVIDFARKVQLNYDCLRAISYELSLCDTFEEAISDLNIVKPDYGQPCMVILMFDNGTNIREQITCDLFGIEEETIYIGSDSEAESDYISIDFIPSDAQYSWEHGGYYIPAKKFKCDTSVEEDSWVMRHHKDFVLANSSEHVVGMLIKPIFKQKSIHYFS